MAPLCALLALLLAGCSAFGPADSTTDFAVGAASGDYAVFAPGTLLWAGTSSFTVVGDGGVELESATALGLPDGLATEWLVSRQADSQAELGLFPDPAVPSLNRAAAHSLAGSQINAADGPVQVIVRFTMPSADVSIHGYRLIYRRDGAEHSLYIPYTDHACITSMDQCPWIQPSP